MQREEQSSRFLHAKLEHARNRHYLAVAQDGFRKGESIKGM